MESSREVAINHFVIPPIVKRVVLLARQSNSMLRREVLKHLAETTSLLA